MTTNDVAGPASIIGSKKRLPPEVSILAVLIGIALALFQPDPLVGLPSGWGGMIGLVTAKGVMSLTAQAPAAQGWIIGSLPRFRFGKILQVTGVTIQTGGSLRLSRRDHGLILPSAMRAGMPWYLALKPAVYPERCWRPSPQRPY